jgi:hypothetical protein
VRDGRGQRTSPAGRVVLSREQDDLVGCHQQLVVGAPRQAPNARLILVPVLVLIDLKRHVEEPAQLALDLLAQDVEVDIVVGGCRDLCASVIVRDGDKRRGRNEVVMVDCLQERVGSVADDEGAA